jgi:hypothetical protein
MAISDFIPFAINYGANVETQANWAANPAAINGFAAGVARSRECNKAWRQPSFVAACLARLMADELNEDVLDDGNLPRFNDQLLRMFGVIAANAAPVREAPVDGFIYGRRNSDWARSTNEAPIDGISYVRRDGNWVNGTIGLELNRFLLLAGGTMTGYITLHAHPSQPMHAATRGWVISEIATIVAGSGYVPEAPMTGGPFGRQGGSWVQVGGADGLFLPLTGGALRNPGGNDPLSIVADSGRYARIRYDSLGTSLWTYGASIDNTFTLANESQGRVRMQTNASGTLRMWCDGGTGLQLNHPNNQDCYINLIGQSNWLVGPQAGQSRFIFFNGAYRAWLTDNGDLMVGNVISADRIVLAGLWFTNEAGNMTSHSRFVAADFQSNSNIYAPWGWVTAGGNVTGWDVIANGSISTNGNIHANGSLASVHDVHARGSVFVNGCQLYNNGGWLDSVQSFQAHDVYARGTVTANNACYVHNGLNVYSGNFWAAGNVYCQYVETNALNVWNSLSTAHNSIYVRWDCFNRGGWAGGAMDIWNATIIIDAGFNFDGSFYGGSMALRATSSAAKIGGGPWDYWSDRRLKRNIHDYTCGLKEIMQLRPISYCYNERFGDICGEVPMRHLLDKAYVGLDADDTALVMPEMVYEQQPDRMSRTTEPYKMISAGPLTYALVNAVKELTARIQVLEERK